MNERYSIRNEIRAEMADSRKLQGTAPGKHTEGGWRRGNPPMQARKARARQKL